MTFISSHLQRLAILDLFFFNDTATTEIYTLSLHDALPIATLDRYIRGENVSPAQLAQVWKTTTQANNGVWDDSSYADFFAAVRDVNSKLRADAQIRVLGGDPGPGDNRSRETAAAALLREQ